MLTLLTLGWINSSQIHCIKWPGNFPDFHCSNSSVNTLQDAHTFRVCGLGDGTFKPQLYGVFLTFCHSTGYSCIYAVMKKQESQKYSHYLLGPTTGQVGQRHHLCSSPTPWKVALLIAIVRNRKGYDSYPGSTAMRRISMTPSMSADM